MLCRVLAFEMPFGKRVVLCAYIGDYLDHHTMLNDFILYVSVNIVCTYVHKEVCRTEKHVNYS